MERRKIVYQDGGYQLLKPRDDGTDRFHRYGKKKSLKAIKDLIERERYDLETDANVRQMLRRELSSKVI